MTAFDRDSAISCLQRLKFEVAGSIGLPDGDGAPLFLLQDAFRKDKEVGRAHGWVYVWAKFHTDLLVDVCYVGKAGKALELRCEQHFGGFKGGSKKGMLNGQRLRQFLTASSDHSVKIFARKSPEAQLLEEDGVSLCEVEERAMIMKMRRLGAGLWNA